MKNPNGFGSVIKLSGNRRNPFMARKTVGWNEKGHPVYKAVGYAPTREEALIMLASFNKNPYDIDARKITVKEVFERYIEIVKLSKSSVHAAKAAWNHCKSIYNLQYNDLRAYHIQECIDFCELSYASKNAIRTLFVNLDKFALERDIIDKCYSSLVSSVSIPQTSKKPFTEEEVALIWKNQNVPWMDTVLILLYSGWRISEFLALTKDDIDLEAQTMRGGTKTDSGKNRIVPIHPKILPFVKKHYNETQNRLFDIKELAYRARFTEALNAIGITHTPHECRHTFRSRLDSSGANKVCIDLLMGHKSRDVGERVYTHKTIAELRSTISFLN